MSNHEITSEQRHDEAMAAKYHELDRKVRLLNSNLSTAYGISGFESGYARKRFTYFVSDEALGRREARPEDAYAKLREMIAAGDEHAIRYSKRPSEALQDIEDAFNERDDLLTEIAEFEDGYTGWSRFFLVTSSPGHIHSSRFCSSCRPTTTFGWLPQLSGRSEEEAVKECGLTLCSVCFPSAPTDWTEGKKITAAQAAKKVA